MVDESGDGEEGVQMELVTDAFSQIELAYASGQAGVAGICLILDPSRPCSSILHMYLTLHFVFREFAESQCCRFVHSLHE